MRANIPATRLHLTSHSAVLPHPCDMYGAAVLPTTIVPIPPKDYAADIARIDDAARAEIARVARTYAGIGAGMGLALGLALGILALRIAGAL